MASVGSDEDPWSIRLGTPIPDTNDHPEITIPVKRSAPWDDAISDSEPESVAPSTQKRQRTTPQYQPAEHDTKNISLTDILEGVIDDSRFDEVDEYQPGDDTGEDEDIEHFDDIPPSIAPTRTCTTNPHNIARKENMESAFFVLARFPHNDVASGPKALVLEGLFQAYLNVVTISKFAHDWHRPATSVLI
ncbi:hypothetical protein VTI74DRAFT_8020 [Chaetomium olivicolor]